MSTTQNTTQSTTQNQGGNTQGGNTQQRPETDYSKLETVTISDRRPTRWYMYIVKRVLKERGSVDIRARPLAVAQCIRVCEGLKKLGYIDYVKYHSTTLESINQNLVRFFVVSVKKTSNFDKLYSQREEERAKLIETYGTSFPQQKGGQQGGQQGGNQQGGNQQGGQQQGGQRQQGSNQGQGR